MEDAMGISFRHAPPPPPPPPPQSGEMESEQMRTVVDDLLSQSGLGFDPRIRNALTSEQSELALRLAAELK